MGFFGYEWLGVTANETHVLRVFQNGGGSGTFERLVFVKFMDGRGYKADGTPYYQLVGKVVRWYPLGDRSSAKVQVNPNKVVISNLPGGKPPVTLTVAQPSGHEK
jgi:hypothetical protein